jgi:hypothetical protein
MKHVLSSKRILMAAGLSASTLLLVACSGDDKQSVDDTPVQHADIKFLYPVKDQRDVPTKAAITLKTTSPITDEAADEHFRVTDSNGGAIAGSIQRSEADPTIINFVPAQALTAGTTYQVHYDGLVTELGPLAPAAVSSFTTRKYYRPDFVVDQSFPRAPFPFLDFGAIYLWLSQDIDPRCISAGDTVSLLDAEDNPVDIHIINQARYLTIDPVEDLTAGAAYRLVLDGLCSQSGAVIDDYELAFTAESSKPRAITPLNLTPSATPGSNVILPTSPLTIDQPFNSAQLNSVFLGPGSAINLSGQLQAELAYLPDHPDYSPFVVRAGNVLNTTSLDVNLAGHVPSLLSSGNGKLTLLSDAVGYMYRNPLAQSDKTTKAIVMTMDTALTVDDGVVNAGISQNTMHVTVTGNAVIEDGMMRIDASGICELRLLNVTWATTHLALHFETPQHHTPADEVVFVPPAKAITLKTSYPENDFDQFMPDDEPFLSFSDPIDIRTAIAGESVKLASIDPDTDAETPIAFTISMSGGNLYLHPAEPLPFGTQFRISVTEALGDRFGNKAGAASIDFSTPVFSSASPLAPLVQGIFPGYGCALTGGNLANNDAGYCLGGESDDVHFNIFPIPADVDVRVFFTQPMLASSFVLGDACDSGSFRVETIDASGNCTGTVPGRLIVKQQQLAFKPDDPWQVDGLYRLTLVSDSSNTSCDDGEICGANNLPLNTDPMNFVHTQTSTTADSDIGGPPLVIPFRGIAPKNAVFVPLLGRPYTDINGNGRIDAEEIPHRESYLTNEEIGAEGIVQNLRIDCQNPPNCGPNDRLTFVNNTLFVDVGEYVPEDIGDLEKGINVDVHPTILHLTSNKLFTDVLGLLPLEVDTGPQQLRVLPKQGGSIASRIIDGGINEAGEQQPPIFDVVVDAYYDAPYVQLLGGIADTTLKSLVVPMHLRGPITFTADDRMIIDMALQNEVTVNVDILILTQDALFDVLGVNAFTQALDAWLDANLGSDHKAGSIAFKIPAGTAGLYLVSEPLQ